MNSVETKKTADQAIAATYKRFPVVFSKGKGDCSGAAAKFSGNGHL